MYDYDQEINREHREQKKRWNGKVITTARQWNNNHDGSREVDSYDMGKVWEAVRDYYDSRDWN